MIIFLLALTFSSSPAKCENRYVATVTFQQFKIFDNRESGDAEISISVVIDSSLKNVKPQGEYGGFVARITGIGDFETYTWPEDEWDYGMITYAHTNILSYGDDIHIYVWENDGGDWDEYDADDDELLFITKTITESVDDSESVILPCFDDSIYLELNYTLQLIRVY